MKSPPSRQCHRLTVLPTLLAEAAILCCGCHDDDFDHNVPAGLGSLLINNETDNDISLFLDGIFQERVTREDKVTPYDLEPGVYRMVLEERDGSRNFRGDIDILQGGRTIVEVFRDPFDRRDYDTVIFFE